MPSGTGGTAGQEAVWFGGGKLAPDLSLPQLRARWEHDENAGHGLAGEEFGAARRGRPGRDGPWGGAFRGPAAELSEFERLRLWVGAEHAVRRAHADISHASSHPTDAAAQAAAQAAAASAAEVLGAVSWLVERKRGGPLHAAAEDYGRAARELHRRTVPATMRSRSGQILCRRAVSARLVKGTETVSCSPCSPSSPPCPIPSRLRHTGTLHPSLRRANAPPNTSLAIPAPAQPASQPVPRAVSTASTRVPPSIVLPPPYRTTRPCDPGPSATRCPERRHPGITVASPF
jgi:hypothetical protein